MLEAVQGVSVVGQPFAAALKKIKGARRPLRLTFLPGASPADGGGEALEEERPTAADKTCEPPASKRDF